MVISRRKAGRGVREDKWTTENEAYVEPNVSGVAQYNPALVWVSYNAASHSEYPLLGCGDTPQTRAIHEIKNQSLELGYSTQRILQQPPFSFGWSADMMTSESSCYESHDAF